MSLPVSSYEELLDRVRCLTKETRRLQRQIHSPPPSQQDRPSSPSPGTTPLVHLERRSGAVEPQVKPPANAKDGLAWSKEQGAPPETKEQEETEHQESDKNIKGALGRNSMCHSTIAYKQGSRGGVMSESSSGLSYSYSGGSAGSANQQGGELGTKVEMVYNLLSMLGTHDRTEMTQTLLAMSSSPDSCLAMRHSGCLSLLVQLVHSSSESEAVKCRAAQALRNMVLSQADDKRGRREARVLRLLDQLTAYCDLVHNNPSAHTEEAHPGPAIAALMKLSFDEEHRLAMCQLGALYVIARLVQVEAGFRLDCCVTVKRYGGMALTNLTFGDGNNKALLCSMRPFMNALIAQLDSSSEDLTQVTASVLRNLSWRADSGSKQALRDVGAVTALMKAAMTAVKEPTLKSVLSALWNLSAHCNQNKVDICAVEGAIQYLVDMLSYQSSSKTLAVVENAGGILRNISSHIAIREDYRKLLREANCLVVLLRQLQSASLTVVSNACGTLWNLSARCPADQRSLVSLGAVPMLTSLAHSKHRMIAMGASAALKNLLPVRLQHHHHTASGGGATLLARKKRALEAELNSSLAETCDNIEPGATWETHTHTSPPQSKDECEQINRSVKEMSLDETSEQPVDYSLKYRETEIRSAPVDNDTVTYNLKYSQEKDEKVFCKSECFRRREAVGEEGDYAETDLDQLTNYSLRYSEEPTLTQQPQPQPSNVLPQVQEGAEETTQEAATVEVDSSPEKHDSGKGGVVETPLMFSRCSSLGSLGSCEPPADDCQSSVVSEFSRMTSGVLSPSDLPDSPSQTVPPSPRSSQPPSIQVVKREPEKTVAGVFDDTMVNFKEESTPVQFSTATSLSDLTILSDEPNLLDVGVSMAERKEAELPVVSEEEDEDVLANCIKVGMQDNRDRVESGEARRAEQRRVIPVKTSVSKQHSQPPPHHEEERPMKFCTEDTPASLSHATSHSELSLLTTASDDDHDNVLAECIQSAMPQGGSEKGSKKETITPPAIKPLSRVSPLTKTRQHRLKESVGEVEDEVSVFATEDTPCNFSVGSSLSDLTINTNRNNRSVGETPPVAENSSPLSSLDPDVSVDEGETVTVLSGGSGDGEGEETTLREQEDQALLMQVISSGMPSVSDKKESDSWPDDTTISLSVASCHSFPSQRDGVVELDGGGVALISHLELESVEPPSNMASVTSLGTSSMGPPSLGIGSLDGIEPPSLLDSVLSASSAHHTMLLDQVRPPADMDELLDLDNSITSCASLTSELAEDSKLSSLNLTVVNNHSSLSYTSVNHSSSIPFSSLNYNSAHLDLRHHLPTHTEQDRRLHNHLPPAHAKQDHHAINQSPFDLADSDNHAVTPWNPDSTGLDDTRFDTFVVKEQREEDIRPRERGKMRRQTEKDRFLTRTIQQPVNDIERLSSVESEEAAGISSSVHSVESESTSDNTDEPPRPIVTKPPEVKSIRGGGKSSIPVVRSPVKNTVAPATGGKKKAGQAPGALQRQGTFTKEEPSSSIPVLVKKSPQPTTVKKTHYAGKASHSSPSWITVRGGMGRGRASSLPSKAPGSGGVRASSSNQSLKSASGGGGSASAPRWHSNTSLNRPPSSASPTSTAPASRIASLWKRVDDSKKKQNLTKDTRLWIPPDPSR